MLQRLIIVLLICASPYLLGRLATLVFNESDANPWAVGMKSIVLLCLIGLVLFVFWRLIDYIVTGD